MVFSHYSWYTAPNDAPIIHALGVAGSTSGINIGANCHNLYVDLSKPHVIVPLRTRPSDSRGLHSSTSPARLRTLWLQDRRTGSTHCRRHDIMGRP